MKKRIVNFILNFLICSLTFITMSISVNAATGSDIVTEARKWIGTPYISSNGSGGYGSGVDCSGLTLQVYSKFGITLPWFADSQRNYGTPIGHYDLKISNSHSNLQLGDLIFFDYKNDGVADHVAIYAGSGNIIHATNSRGVVEAPLSWNTGVINGQRFYNAVCEVRRLVGGGGSSGSKPTSATLSINKSLFSVGETVYFSVSSQGATGYTIGIDKDGARIYTADIGSSFEKSFTEPGCYTAYVTAWNLLGLVDSNRVVFNIYDSAPDNNKLSANKTIISVGEEITFYFDAENAKGYTIGIDKDNQRILTQDIGDNTFTKSFTEPGKYSVYVSAWNDKGLLDSNRIYFTVYNAAPTSSELKIDKKEISVGDSIKFTCISEEATGYTIGIDRDGIRIYTADIGSSYEQYFNEPGKYSAYVTAWNSFGLVDSNRIYFTVSAKPSKPSLRNAQETYDTRDYIPFRWNKTENTTDYVLDLYKMTENYYNGQIISRDYQHYKTIETKELYTEYKLPQGEYKAVLCAVNQNSWDSDNDSWEHTYSDPFFFTVKEPPAEIISLSVGRSDLETSASVIIENISSETPGVLIVAGYENGILVTKETKPLTTENEGKTLYFTLDGKVNEVKAFVWNSLGKMIPLCEPRTIKLSK